MEEQDHHGLNLNLTLKCPDHHLHNVVSPPQLPPLPPPSTVVAPPQSPPPPPPSAVVAPLFGFLSPIPTRPFKLTTSPYNFLSAGYVHINRPLNFKPPSYDDEYIEEKRRQVATTVVKDYGELVGSSQQSTVSTMSLSGNKRQEREENYIVLSDDEDGGDMAASSSEAAARKKLMLSKDQAAVLEETFKEHHTLDTMSGKQKVSLAKQLDLQPRQVEVWFQNRRASTKLKQTMVDRRYLKRCCETLCNENKRLQKELDELRALKLHLLTNINMYPPTTFTMCPECELVYASSSSSSSLTQASFATTITNNNPQNSTDAYSKAISTIPFHKLISSKALDRRPQP